MSPLRKLFRPMARRRQSAADAALADPIVERLVQATDRRLASVSGYRQALRAPVLAARDRLAGMIARIPGPTEVSPRAWSEQQGLRPLFVKAEDAAAAWSRDQRVRAFFDGHPASDCFGMLALLQADRRVLAVVQQGESMQAEVARTTVSFGEPQVLAPAASEAGARAELVLRAMEYLAMRAMERVGAMRAGKRELEQERALLQAKLQLARRQGRGLGSMAAASGAGADAATLERDLARTVEALEQAASRDLLPALLEELLSALERPEEHLTIEPCSLALDAMNFAVAASPQAITPCVAILKLANRGPFAVLLARLPRGELRAPENRLAEAEKYL